MRLNSLVMLCVLLVLAPVTAARQDALKIHDLTQAPSLDVGANFRIKKVMGEAGTFLLGEFSVGFKNAPHHHTYEQINLGVTGAYNVVTGDGAHAMARLRGLHLPPDVRHGNDVTASAANPTLIEFQTARRIDFPPEREKVVFPRAATPVADPPSMEFDFTAASAAWERLSNGARINVKKGITAAVTAWDIPARVTDPITLRAQLPGAELYIYVLEGGADFVSGASRRPARTGALLVNPPGAAAVQARAGKDGALLVVFEAAKP